MTTVATMRPGDTVDAVLACVRKERQITRAGAPYLTLELRDATGQIVARAFRCADELAGRFDRGDLVRVRGRVSRFRDEAQIDIAKVERADRSDVDLAQFLPASRRDIDELEGFFEHLVREVYEGPLRGMLESILGDEALRGQLRQAPCTLPAMAGAKGQRHHAYLGGLLEHTVAVGTMALELCTLHPSLDRDLLLAAALVHDIGKCREFEYGAEISRSPEGAMLGHIELGMRLIDRNAPPALQRERRLALEHCVLMHHGAERGSNERFASAEAVALFRLNALDASVKGAVEHGLGR